MAKSLVSSRTDAIGLLVDNLSWSFFSELAERVQNAAEKHGYSVFIYSSQKSAGLEKAGVERFMSRGIDGLLVYATEKEENRAFYSELDKLGIPVLFFNHFLRMDVNCVTTDDYDGTIQAIRHLGSLGHRRIAYVGSGEESSFKQQRLAGYRDGLNELGVEASPHWIGLEEDDPAYGYRKVKAWLAAPADERPTAVFAQNDMLAFGIYRAAAEAGLRVPDDLSVIGFDDLDVCQLMHPPLTTVRIPLKQLAEAAIRFMLDRFAAEAGGEAVRLKTTLSPSLIIRQSTAPLKQ
ncbi:LacI family DNA-binding transcriptional regulator [Cohnella nanjingensis]|nr:substrate-binding domain-containing protein [Cohnella nanjingensis]